MSGVFSIEGTITLIAFFAMLAVKIYAFVNALLYSAESYQAAGKLTKPAWCIILALAVVLQFVGIGGMILNLAGIVAAFVYLADVRPALSSLTRRR